MNNGLVMGSFSFGDALNPYGSHGHSPDQAEYGEITRGLQLTGFFGPNVYTDVCSQTILVGILSAGSWTLSMKAIIRGSQ